ncbi:MAG: thiamine-binding protein [Clostridiaceae bacterium]|nr:thiamine-binding protein [Clostridiaceae bacterium]MBW4860446.1 thiamine-binding protein [Clostridiaceae bacterium]MBW4868362.1 thiamine-binding protein [Clostridiaceae bacterium]
MCTMGKIASCEIAFIPIVSDDYVLQVDKVLNIIKSYDIEYNVGILSTTIRGDIGKIHDLIFEVYNNMDKECKFTMDIKLSNICGCD